MGVAVADRSRFRVERGDIHPLSASRRVERLKVSLFLNFSLSEATPLFAIYSHFQQRITQ